MKSSVTRTELLAFWNFFFQAEDGIRDLYVTGVQTCALPISTKQYVDATATGLDVKSSVRAASTASFTVTYANGASGVGRSEERRVGKECRSRWWAYH